jgi:hypothetical protein
MKQTGVILAAASLAAGLLIGGAGPASAALQTLQVVNDLCNQAAKKAETDARIPRNLLTAISLAESGRWDDRRKASFAWPWTVTNGASATYYPTKEEAIEGVKELRAAGKTNIDVGCMQINLHHHPNAFESLEDAFDPVTNVGYASRFLAGLQKETESWAEAAGRYHSSDPTRLGAYRDKVLGLWERVSGRKQTELGKIQVVKPDAEEIELRRIQQATIQMQFRARLQAERNAPKNSRAMAQFEKFRADRWGPNFRAQSAAVQKAETERRRVSDLSAGKMSFAEKRQAQMAAWRQSRSAGAFRQ